ncbi:MAG: RNA polymerase factor sigma-54 [Alphaproteobacteria bacterium]|nr:RNA polymerase factor sigma-54 [Alphaproteobacteria bacterium]
MTKLTQRLDLRQSQQLVMTPQLQQAIKLLQLNNMELTEFLEEELAQNPLLEKAEADGESGEGDTAPEAEERDEVQAEFDESWTGNEAESAVRNHDFDAGTVQAGAGGSRNFDEMDESFEKRTAEEKTLREHLTAQMEVAFSNPADRKIGGLLIDQVDESGYLRADIAELAGQLGCPPERIEKLLQVMKGFDPTGVFAADLAECLALQLAEKNTLDGPMQKLLQNLQLIASHDLKTLAAKCGVNSTYLQDMIAEIRELNPKPASAFDHVVAQTAIPDVLMKRLPKNLGGGWRVELNSETLPRVLVNQQYYTEVLQHAVQKKDKDYLSNQMQSATWLVRSLDQRAQTILKTAAAIVEEQDAFFNYGIEFLKPLTLKDIAETIQMHESTVSRVTTNKYIGTPRGIFELKFFFSTALISEDGMSHSAEAVRARIKSLIDAEDPKKILSDDRIVEMLKAEGIDIARRTVAKYREGMNIASSVLRRRQKNN